MPRFTDIEATPKLLSPVYGYLTAPLLPLHKAIEPISPQVEQLDRFSRIAKNECHFPSEHGLTRDESASIFLYTMEWGENSFYQVINRALRAEDRSTLKPWFAYLKLFDAAAQKLPNVRKNVWRGVKKDISNSFKLGDEFTWWTISSCSTSVNVIKDFLGPNSTLFLIEAVNGKDVSKYTNYPNENEVILCPGTRLRVISDPLDQPPMHLVHLQEITDDAQEQITNSLSSMSMVSSLQSTLHSQVYPGQTCTDDNGNRYEGEMKHGKKHGRGKMDYANGSKYNGIWVNDTKTGQGVLVYANGNRYEGQWKDDTADGQGVFIYANGNRFEGQWKDNKRNGQGVLVYANGNRYEGQWKDDTANGQGVFIYANGNRFEGQWKDNKKDGNGKMIHANSTVQDGVWRDDKFMG